MEDLEAQIDAAFLRDYGTKAMLERFETEGDDHSRELAEVGQQIADLTAERFVQQIIRPDYDKMMAALQAEHARISALPVGDSMVEWVDMGKTLGAAWEALPTMTERGRLLARMGTTALVHREEGVNVLLWVPPNEQTVVEIMAGAARAA
jgi:hypothetical protein